MSSDKALADRVVALGVGNRKGTVFWRNPDGHTLDAPYFVRDPRVAIALMERLDDGELTIWKQKYKDFDSVWIVETHLTRADGHSDSLPRAIVEAAVKALEES